MTDGTLITFTLRTSRAAIRGAASPSWGGSAVGNTAFPGIAGSPIIYESAAGAAVSRIFNITLTPPAVASQINSYMFVAADGEPQTTAYR